jgi:hypothetical protein
MTRYQKPIKVSDTQVAAVAIHPVELTSAQKAERAQKQADMAAVVAAADKRMQEAEKNKTVENNGIYTSNVSSLSLENAKKNLGFAQLMIERHEDVGSTFHGRYGDTELKSATEWEAALKDYIGKQEAAASMYSKVQEMS